MAHFEIGDDPWEVVRRHAPPPPGEALAQALQRLVGRGFCRIAIYGAGRFCADALASHPALAETYPLVAIVDDDQRRHGESMAGLSVISSGEALALGIDAVVLASQWYADELWQASSSLRRAGIFVTTLEARYAGKKLVDTPSLSSA